MNSLLEKNQEINKELSNSNNNELTNEKEQKRFLETTLGKTINTAVDIGLRWVLPDFIENQVIDVKDSLIKGGLKEGINTVIDNAVDMGKSVMGIFTGKFDSISQAKEAVKNGGDFLNAELVKRLTKRRKYDVKRYSRDGRCVCCYCISRTESQRQ